jgi:uncharacterized membrane protein YraQ (UPF0718 family)
MSRPLGATPPTPGSDRLSSTDAANTSAPANAGRPPRISMWTLAAALFILAAVAAVFCAQGTAVMGDLSIAFVAIVIEALPFLALGALLSGVIEVFIPRSLVASLLPRNTILAILGAGLLGLVLPMCECGIIPVTRRLVRKGVPFSVAIAYLLAGPIVNPIVAASTAVAYAGDWLIVAARLVSGFAVAVCVALVIDEFYPGFNALLPKWRDVATDDDATEEPCVCGHDHEHPAHDHHDHGDADQADAPPAVPPPLPSRLGHAAAHAADDFLHISQFLIVGAFVAALCQTSDVRAGLVGLADTPAASILVMMVLAIVLNLCSEADAFVAASFRQTLPLSAQLAFMVLGPMLDLKLIAMYASFVRRNAIILISILMCVLVFAMMLSLNLFGWDQT